VLGDPENGREGKCQVRARTEGWGAGERANGCGPGLRKIERTQDPGQPTGTAPEAN